MNRVRRKLVFSAMAAVLVLLTALLAVINVINFALVAEDADRVTEMIAGDGGEFRDKMKNEKRPDDGASSPPMGPDSPETPFTARYFTVRITKDGRAETVAHNVAAITEDEAKEIAVKLAGEKTGWVNTTYRYRVYKKGGDTYVTAVDQSRELSPSYRILIISVIGEITGLAVCLAFLSVFSKRLIRPVEEADRKQKEFIKEAEAAIKVPLTVIGADVEIIERTSGPTDRTGSIRRQVEKMTAITKRLGTLPLIGEGKTEFDLTSAVRAAVGRYAEEFEKRGIRLDLDIGEGIGITTGNDGVGKVAEQLVDNAAKFALTRAAVTLRRDGDRVKLTVSNDADLPDGSVEIAFDRFVRLQNSGDLPGDGLGLTFVRDTVREAGGRVAAECKDGEFSVRVTL